MEELRPSQELVRKELGRRQEEAKQWRDKVEEILLVVYKNLDSFLEVYNANNLVLDARNKLDFKFRKDMREEMGKISQDHADQHFRLKEIEGKLDKLLGDSFILIPQEKEKEKKRKKEEKVVDKGYSLRKKPRKKYN